MLRVLRKAAGACVTMFVLLFALPAFAETPFDISGSTLTAYLGTDAVVTVPDGVTSIGEHAFYQNETVEQIIFPDTLTHIESSAFEGCAALQAVSFSSGTTDIGNAAFKDCRALESVTLPRAVSALGAQAFYGCICLDEFTAYEHLMAIGVECFGDCDSLVVRCPEGAFIGGYAELIGASVERFTYSVQDDFIVDGTVLVGYSGQASSVTLPEDVTEIGAYAFLANTAIESIETRAQLEVISPYAFYGCASLTAFSDQSALQSLGAFSFSDCSALTDIVLAGDYTSVPESAFQGCDALCAVTLPAEIMVIGPAAFSGCGQLATLPIDENTTCIGDSAFYGCVGITRAILPDSVNTLGDGVFAGCTRLTDFSLPQNLRGIGEATFKNCTELQQASFPNGLKAIGDSAFEGCTQLSEVTLPESLEVIGDEAFKDTALFGLTLPEFLMEMGDRAFYHVFENTTIFIPSGVSVFGDDIFGENEGIVIQCYYQSGAYEYAVGAGLEYELIGDSDNPFLIDNGVLIRYFGMDTAIQIPQEVITIGENAFRNKTALISVEIPDTVSKIEQSAFETCRSLRNVYLPVAISTVGAYAFKNCTGLVSVTVSSENAVFDADAFLDTSPFTANVYFNSIADGFFTAMGKQVIYLPDELPVETIVLDDMPVRMLGDSGVVISGQVKKHNQPAPGAAYRVAYQKQGEAWWTYASTSFTACEPDGTFSKQIDLSEEGQYVFCVEAKTKTGTGVETQAQTEPIAVYFYAYPVSPIISLTAEKSDLMAGEAMALRFETEEELAEQAVQTSVSYSKNSIDWIEAGSTWSEPLTIGANGGRVVFTLPEELAEAEYTFRLSLRAEGRETADTMAECTAWVYRVMPVQRVDFIELTDVIVVPVKAKGVYISADANGYPGYDVNAQYCFYYSYNGGAFRRFKNWSMDSTALFKPASEGQYVLKVEARNAGRVLADVEKVSESCTVYKGGIPATNLKLSTVKDTYEYGEAIDLYMMLTEGAPSQNTQYQVLYAKGEAKRFVALTGWEEYAPEHAQTGVTTRLFIPVNSADLKYRIKVQVKTEGRAGYDTSEIKEVYLRVADSVNCVTMTPMENPTVQSVLGITLKAVAQKEDESLAYAEYRFAYRATGTTRWRYIKAKFSYNKSVAFSLGQEGVYDFRVEARTAGTTATAAADEILSIRVYKGGIPAQGVSIALEGDKTEYLIDQCVALDVTGFPCADERYADVEYAVMYSTNGKRYRVLKGYDFGQYDGKSPISLPKSKRDAVYYLKIAIRTEGRTGTDALSDPVEIYRYLVLPSDQVTLSVDGNNPQVITSGQGVTLRAKGFRRGEETLCEYRYLYREAGTTKWRYISKAFSTDEETDFVPRYEGKYEFCVQARTVGRKTIDAVFEVSEAFGLFYDALPAVAVTADIGEKTKYLYGETIPINISAVGNGEPDSELEFQVLVSTNNRRWKPLPDFIEYQPLELTEGKTRVDIDILNSRDKKYYIRVNVRTTGRAGTDAHSTTQADMYTIMPLADVGFNAIEAGKNGQIVLRAAAVQSEGYENLGYIPKYRFYYRVSGTARWRAKTLYSEKPTCDFTPVHPTYDFMVYAVNSGRKGIDAVDIIEAYAVPLD